MKLQCCPQWPNLLHSIIAQYVPLPNHCIFYQHQWIQFSPSTVYSRTSNLIIWCPCPPLKNLFRQCSKLLLQIRLYCKKRWINSWSSFNNSTTTSLHNPPHLLNKIMPSTWCICVQRYTGIFEVHCTPTKVGDPWHHQISWMQHHCNIYAYTSNMDPHHSHNNLMTSPNKEPSLSTIQQLLHTARTTLTYGNHNSMEHMDYSAVHLSLLQPTITYCPLWPPLPYRMYVYRFSTQPQYQGGKYQIYHPPYRTYHLQNRVDPSTPTNSEKIYFNHHSIQYYFGMGII